MGELLSTCQVDVIESYYLALVTGRALQSTTEQAVGQSSPETGQFLPLTARASMEPMIRTYLASEHCLT
jgi:hypothetical protein